jgi:hypothetical protein
MVRSKVVDELGLLPAAIALCGEPHNEVGLSLSETFLFWHDRRSAL